MTGKQRWQIAPFLVAPLAFLAVPGPARHATLASGDRRELVGGLR